jgi:polyhydroxyalkanoate synthesis regulator protein
MSMKTFNQQQEKWRDYMSTTVGEDKAKAFEEQVRKNMSMFEDTMKFFAPFVPGPPGAPGTNGMSGMPGMMPGMPGAAPTGDAPKPSMPPTGIDAIRALQQQMMDMQRQLAQLTMGSFAPPTDKPKDG